MSKIITAIKRIKFNGTKQTVKIQYRHYYGFIGNMEEPPEDPSIDILSVEDSNKKQIELTNGQERRLSDALMADFYKPSQRIIKI